MAETTSHPEGTFCWVELSTSDQKGGVAFYRNLFGWGLDDQPMGPTETYSLLKVNGKDAAAACTLRAEEKNMNVPPHWNMYIAVKNVDEMTKKAEQLGGKVLAQPFDVMDAGRMSVIQDPTGAVFELWQSGKSQGMGVKGQAGTLCWSELTTGNTKAAHSFYTQLFGWSLKPSTMPDMEYTEFSVGGKAEGGIMPTPKEMPNVPPNWLPYFMVDDVDGTAKKATSDGGKALVPPTDIPNTGRFSVLMDPQGAPFAVFKPKMA